jgi:hypothetical protein
MGRKRKRRNRQKYFFMEGLKDLKKERQKKKDKKNKKTASSSSSSSGYSSSRYSSHYGSYGGYGGYYGSSYSGSSYSSSSKKQPVQNPDNVINTDKGCFEFSHHAAWGTILVPVEDPKGCKVTVDEVNGIKLIDVFPKIPADLWARYIDLCFHFCPEKTYSYGSGYTSPSYTSTHNVWNAEKKTYEKYRWEGGRRVLCTEKKEPFGFAAHNSRSGGSVYSSSHSSKSNDKELEVSVLLCRKADDLSKWRILVPKQDVSGGSVHAQTAESCDIETGEMFNVFPPEGWLHAGSSHSHNTMSAFFSPTDDKSELTVPGLHIVIGKVDKKDMSYEHKSSIVLRQLRKKVDLFDVVDANPNKATFHPNVLKMVSEKSWKVVVSGSSKSASASSSSSTVKKSESKTCGSGQTSAKTEEDTKTTLIATPKGVVERDWSHLWEDDDDDVHVSPFCRRREVETTSSRKTIGPWSHLEDLDIYDGLESWTGAGVPASAVVDSKDEQKSTCKDEQIEHIDKNAEVATDEETLDIEEILRYYEEMNLPIQDWDWTEEGLI